MASVVAGSSAASIAMALVRRECSSFLRGEAKMNLILARVRPRRRGTDSSNHFFYGGSGSTGIRSSRPGLLTALLLALALLSSASSTRGQFLWRPNIRPEQALSAAEFSRLFRDLSEEGGYFRSDNFTSNETSYLHVVDKLRELGATGGAYIGVGPEQNFTYIAKVRPRIAFILDIRRQALIQHLMFKAIFHLAPSRVQYLSLLLSKPVPKEKSPGPDASTSEILSVFSQAPSDDRAYTSNLAAIRKAIKDDFQVQLSDADQASLSYVYKNFHDDALEIAYRMEGTRGGWFP